MSHEIPEKVYMRLVDNVIVMKADRFIVAKDAPSPLGYKFYAGLALAEYRKGSPLSIVYMLAKSALGHANRLKCQRRKAACLKVLGIIRRRMANA